MKPIRGTGAAAVLATAVNAGTIASSSGSPKVAPTPRRNVRRGSASFVITIPILSFVRILRPHSSSCHRRRSTRSPPLERHTVDDTSHQRFERVLARGGITHDRADVRLVRWLRAAAERVADQLRDHGAGELLIERRPQE